MRRKPKVESILRAVNVHDPRRALGALAAHGYDVLPAAQVRRERHARLAAEQEAEFVNQEREATERWGQKGYEEARHLRDRCSFLYEQAIARGATRDDLAGAESGRSDGSDG